MIWALALSMTLSSCGVSDSPPEGKELHLASASEHYGYICADLTIDSAPFSFGLLALETQEESLSDFEISMIKPRGLVSVSETVVPHTHGELIGGFGPAPGVGEQMSNWEDRISPSELVLNPGDTWAYIVTVKPDAIGLTNVYTDGLRVEYSISGGQRYYQNLNWGFGAALPNEVCGPSGSK